MSEAVLTLDGNFEQPLPIKTPKVIYPIPNFTRLFKVKQEYAQLATKHRPPQLGITHPTYSNAILVDESGHTNIGGGLLSFTRTFCTVPADPFVQPEMLSYTFPGYLKRTPVWKNTHTINGLRTWQITEWKERIFREPKPKQVVATVTTRWHNLLNSGYFDPSVTADGYSFEGLPIVQPFQVFDAKKTIEESLMDVPVVDSDGNITTEQRTHYQTILGTVEITSHTSDTSTPSNLAYESMKASRQPIQAQATKVEQYIGCIYTTKDIQIKAE